MRGLVHLTAALAVAAVAVAFGRWLRDPAPGGPVLALLAASLACAIALRHLYRPGGLGRRARRPRAREPVAVSAPGSDAAAPPPDDALDLNTAGVAELQRLPGIGPVAARRIVEERERGGPFRSPGDLARVPGFGPSRIRGLSGRVRVGR